MNVGMQEILSAANRLSGRVVRTPLIHSPVLSRETGAEVWFKPENWQRTGSFKLRGAYNKMAQLSEAEKQRGVITASAGNHAQGVALAGQMLNISVMVLVPENTPKTKVDGIKSYGAEVALEGRLYDESEAIAHQRAQETGRVFIHAFEDEAIVAGQGTVGLEMLLDTPALDLMLVPAGGGGLLCGIGAAARALAPGCRVVGVQTEASPVWYESWRAGRILDVTYRETWAEGLLGGIGRQNFEMAQKVVDGFEVVQEAEVRKAMRWAVEQHHWILEGSGAAALAFALTHPETLKGRRTGIVLTGANVDPGRIGDVLSPA